MPLLEAIQKCGENWFRPVGSSGIAFRIVSDHMCITDGEINYFDYCLLKQNIIGDWEIVTPEKVRGERG